MRQERIIQASLFDVFAQHEIGRELKAMSQWLDEHGALLGLVAGDLRRHGIRETGRHGLPAEAVLRSALLKQQRRDAGAIRGRCRGKTQTRSRAPCPIEHSLGKRLLADGSLCAKLYFNTTATTVRS